MMQGQLIQKTGALVKCTRVPLTKWNQGNNSIIGTNSWRFITTKQPTKATAAAAKPAHYDEDADTKSEARNQQAGQPQDQETNPNSSNDDQNKQDPEKSRERWQTSKVKKIKEEPKVISTCETAEESDLRIRNTFFKYPPKNEADTLPEHEDHGIIHLFTRSKGLSLENIQFMRTIVGAEGHSIKQFNIDRKWAATVDDQTFREKRFEMLGPDLAAAHFIVFRDGKVRFHGNEEWVFRDENDKYDLPANKVEGLKLRDVDASCMELVYEGLENLNGCSELESINLSSSPHVDNFFIDRICRQHHGSLRSLDISHCPLITLGAITSLARLTKLKELTLTGLQMEHLLLACMTLEDEQPGLVVKGLSKFTGFDTLCDREADSIHDRLTDLRSINDADKRP